MLTILTPTIGRDTLRNAARSVMAQTSPAWDWVIMGDGCSPVVDGDPRIRCYSGDFSHAGYARNAAIYQVRTEWVGFLDDDDLLLPDYVATVKSAIDDSSADIIIFRMRYASNKTGHPEGKVLWAEREIVRGNVGISFAAKTEVVKEVRFPQKGKAQDFFFLKKAAANGYVVEFNEKVVYEVRP